jgi:hypothetical protein
MWSEDGDALGLEVVAHLLEHVLVAGLLKIGRDDLLGVGICGVTLEPKPRRPPKRLTACCAGRTP